MLRVARAKAVAQMYLSGCDRWKPSVSFLFGAFTIASPAFQAVGDGEILRDDPFRLVCVPKWDWAEDNCDMCSHHPRAGQTLGADVPEAHASLRGAAGFIGGYEAW